MQNTARENRLTSLIRRTIADIRLLFTAGWFAVRFRRNNKMGDLFRFRRAIEIGHISPFRRLFTGKKENHTVNLTLPQFGNALVEFDINDPFQMAICEEFVKYGLYDLDRLKFVPDCSIDCGAYQGYFTLLIHARFPACKKICVEPHPVNFRQLIGTMKRNRVDLNAAYNKALSSSGAALSLELWGSNMSATTDKTLPSYIVEVPSMSLQEVMRGILPTEKTILKMDIEGGELDFFPGIIPSLPDTCAVFLETHDGWNSLPAIRKEFEISGFEFTVIRERTLYIDVFAQRVKKT
jgi:FkbM family methyltransferase